MENSNDKKHTYYLGENSKPSQQMQDRLPSKLTGKLGPNWKLKCKIDTQFASVALAEEMIVGRTMDEETVDFDLTPFDAYHYGVSRRHAKMTLEDGFLYIEDLGSTNGTRINGFQLASKQRYRLREGDEIEFARLRMTIKFEM